MLKNLNIRYSIISLVLIAFLGNGFYAPVYAQELNLPAPGTMVHLSPSFNPPILKGIKVSTNNPFKFDFILDKGAGSANLKEESTKLIKYFLAVVSG